MGRLHSVKSSLYSKVKGQIIMEESRSLNLCYYSNIFFSFFLVPISSENSGSKKHYHKKPFYNYVLYSTITHFLVDTTMKTKNFFLQNNILFNYVNKQYIIHDSNDIYCKSKNVKTVKFFNI